MESIILSLSVVLINKSGGTMNKSMSQIFKEKWMKRARDWQSKAEDAGKKIKNMVIITDEQDTAIKMLRENNQTLKKKKQVICIWIYGMQNHVLVIF